MTVASDQDDGKLPVTSGVPRGGQWAMAPLERNRFLYFRSIHLIASHLVKHLFCLDTCRPISNRP